MLASWFVPGVASGALPGEGSWTVDASRLRCTLAHEIPAYGSVRFVAASGEPLSLAVHAARDRASGGAVRVISTAPAWRTGVVPEELGRAGAGGDGGFAFGAAAALRVLHALESGLAPTVLHPRPGAEPVTASLSPVQFRPALQAFRSCRSELLPFGFAAVRESRVHFDVDRAVLDAEALARLEPVARYVRLDPAVRSIEVSGHTDATGSERRNRELARERAQVVADLLVEQGVPPQLVVIDARAATEPVGDNRIDVGRAANRRTEVRLHKR